MTCKFQMHVFVFSTAVLPFIGQMCNKGRQSVNELNASEKVEEESYLCACEAMRCPCQFMILLRNSATTGCKWTAKTHDFVREKARERERGSVCVCVCVRVCCGECRKPKR